jgi:hypothetical protein
MRAGRPLRVSRLTKWPVGCVPQPATGGALVQRELYRELTERHLVVLERRDGIHRLPRVLPAGSLGSPSANMSATSSPVVAESAVVAMMAPGSWSRPARQSHTSPSGRYSLPLSVSSRFATAPTHSRRDTRMRFLVTDDFSFLLGVPDLMTDPCFPSFASTLPQAVAPFRAFRESASAAKRVADQPPNVMDFRWLYHQPVQGRRAFLDYC